MSKLKLYRVRVDCLHIFTLRQDEVIEVEAETEEEALKEAKVEATEEAECFNAEHDKTVFYNALVLSEEVAKPKELRCKKTIDLFKG